MSYEFETFRPAFAEGVDPAAAEAAPDPATDGFLQAVSLGFHNSRPVPRMRAAWTRDLIADDTTLWVARSTDPIGGGLPSHHPVATLASWTKTLNVGDGTLLPCHSITDVTVRQTHRRRGLVRQILTSNLLQARESGLPIAALTVTEGSIYGRFGFGVATWKNVVTVKSGRTFALRPEIALDSGVVEMVDPHEHADTFVELADRLHAQTFGSIGRPHFYHSLSSGLVDFESGDRDAKRRAAVHFGADGPDGYVSYELKGSDDGETITIRDFVALTPAAHLGLWQLLGTMDLVVSVDTRAPLGDPLRPALADPRNYRITGQRDGLWLRILDTCAALSARAWTGSGRLVLEIVDPVDGLAGGRYLLDVTDGRAEVSETTAEADITLTAETLASLYLGGTQVGVLAAAGRVQGSPAAISVLSGLSRTDLHPWAAADF